MNAALMLDVARTGWALSPLGRRFALGFCWHTRRLRRRSAPAALRDPAQRRRFLRSLRACDAAFGLLAPAGVCRRAGRLRHAVYRRFVPFAWLNTEVRARTLEAFALPCDDGALQRLAMVAMVIREWNDMLDRFPPALLLRVRRLEEPQPPQACLLLDHMLRTRQALIPRDRFPRFHALDSDVARIYTPPPGAGSLRAVLEHKSQVASLLALRGAVEVFPDAAAEVLRPFSTWFYLLDEYADLARDRAAGRATFLTSAADPYAELLAACEAAQQRLRDAAPHPGPLLALMSLLMDTVQDARRAGVEIEDEYFHAGGTA